MQETEKRQRTIRSFVRRAGRMTPSQGRALNELWPKYGLDYAENLLDFAAEFGRRASVILEIGFGNGETLVEQAASHPDRDFLGIEVHEPGIGHCLLKAEEADIRNLKVIAHDAVEVLRNQVPLLSVARFNLYFPDPWPKKRHHKRRIVQDAFVDLVVTPARLEQGVSEACGGEYQLKRMGEFIRWVSADVQKETKAELDAAGLTWKQVQKAVASHAREWLKSKVS